MGVDTPDALKFEGVWIESTPFSSLPCPDPNLDSSPKRFCFGIPSVETRVPRTYRSAKASRWFAVRDSPRSDLARAWSRT